MSEGLTRWVWGEPEIVPSKREPTARERLEWWVMAAAAAATAALLGAAPARALDMDPQVTVMLEITCLPPNETIEVTGPLKPFMTAEHTSGNAAHRIMNHGAKSWVLLLEMKQGGEIYWCPVSGANGEWKHDRTPAPSRRPSQEDRAG